MYWHVTLKLNHKMCSVDKVFQNDSFSLQHWIIQMHFQFMIIKIIIIIVIIKCLLSIPLTCFELERSICCHSDWHWISFSHHCWSKTHFSFSFENYASTWFVHAGKSADSDEGWLYVTVDTFGVYCCTICL